MGLMKKIHTYNLKAKGGHPIKLKANKNNECIITKRQAEIFDKRK